MWIALGLVALIVAGGLTWTYRYDLYSIVDPLAAADAPSFLDPANPLVASAAEGTTDQQAVLGAIRAAMHTAMPAFDDLWGTRARYGFEPANVALWTSARGIQLRSFPSYRVPRSPTWTENPYRNSSWEADYQSLAWLRAPQAAYNQTGNRTYLYQIKAYVLSWIGASTADPPPTDRTWYDDAVSIRTDVLVSLLSGDLWEALGNKQLAIVLGSLERHGTLLDSYLHDPAFIGHNHNLFHALSLYNLATAFPQLRDASRWKTDARARLSSLLPELVDESEGASTEGAAWYHYVVLQSYAAAEAYLARRGDTLSTAEQNVIASMTSFGAELLAPTGETPAIGDTPYGSPANLAMLRDLASQGIGSNIAQFVLSHGSAGARPPDAVFAKTAGYAIMRPVYSPGDAWLKDVQVVVDTTNAKRTHGHDDALAPILNGGGGPLLIDSGGPYLYGKTTHRDFVGPAAHNTVLDGNQVDARGDVTNLIESDDALASIVSGSQGISATATDQRAIVLVKPDVLLVIDQVAATDTLAHQYSLLYHLPPAATVSTAATTGTNIAGSVSAANAAMGFRVIASAPMTYSTVVAQGHPLLGWVTTAVGAKVPAPMLQFQAAGPKTWFVAAFHPGISAGLPPALTVQPDGRGGITIDVTVGTTSAQVLVDQTGRVAISRAGSVGAP